MTAKYDKRSALWDAEKTQCAIDLHASGKTMKEIAVIIFGDAKYKNCVVGKLHRATDTRKPNPIKRLTPQQRAEREEKKAALRASRGGRNTLQPRKTVLVGSRHQSAVTQKKARACALRQILGAEGIDAEALDHLPALREFNRKPTPPITLSMRKAPSQGCCWPLGDPRKPGFRFCEAATARTYCDEHHAVAYQPEPDLRWRYRQYA